MKDIKPLNRNYCNNRRSVYGWLYSKIITVRVLPKAGLRCTPFQPYTNDKRCTNAHFSSTPLLLCSVCYRAFLIQIMDYAIVDEKGNIVGTIRETYPVRFVDPERDYDVNYLAPHQSLTKQREEGYFTLKGKCLTQNQIWQLFLLGSL